MKAAIVIGIALLLMGAVLLAYGQLQGSTSEDLGTAGNETPQLSCAFDNGYNVCLPLRDTYLQYKDFLGVPVTSFDIQKTRQCFTFACLTYHPENAQPYQVQVGNMGTEAIRQTGRTPRLGAEPHQGVRAWVRQMQENGFDTSRLVGGFVSEPILDEKTGVFTQYAEKMVFVFPKDAAYADEISRKPIGLQYAPIREQRTKQGNGNQLPLLPMLIGLAGAGTVALLLTSRGKRSSGGTI